MIGQIASAEQANILKKQAELLEAQKAQVVAQTVATLRHAHEEECHVEPSNIFHNWPDGCPVYREWLAQTGYYGRTTMTEPPREILT